jgi:hypothetical protein
MLQTKVDCFSTSHRATLEITRRLHNRAPHVATCQLVSRMLGRRDARHGRRHDQNKLRRRIVRLSHDWAGSLRGGDADWPGSLIDSAPAGTGPGPKAHSIKRAFICRAHGARAPRALTPAPHRAARAGKPPPYYYVRAAAIGEPNRRSSAFTAA